MIALKRYALVLAIYPTNRGFAYVVFEGHLSPIDRGIARRDGHDKNSRCLKLIAALCLRYEPDVLVLQDTSPTGTQRSLRIANLNIAIHELAESPGIPVHSYSRTHVRLAFSHLGSPTKYAIAEAIAKHIPAFERHLPPPRKRWMAEDSRMGIFDAAALALTFFHDSADGLAAA
jgi:Holliday junction resolvasome RuvABC endonuclease subunit